MQMPLDCTFLIAPSVFSDKTQNEDKESKKHTTIQTQTQITYTRHQSSFKQLGVTTNGTSLRMSIRLFPIRLSLYEMQTKSS
jgi:hypothetical protein